MFELPARWLIHIQAGNCNSKLEVQVVVPFKYQGSLHWSKDPTGQQSVVVWWSGINNNQHIVSMGISRYLHRI